MAVLDKEAFIETFEHVVEAADHLGGKVDELVKNLPVVLLEMRPLHLENGVLQQLELIQLAFVNLLALHAPLIHSIHLEVHDKVLKVADDLLRVNVGSVDHSHFFALERICLLYVLRGGRS